MDTHGTFHIHVIASFTYIFGTYTCNSYVYWVLVDTRRIFHTHAGYRKGTPTYRQASTDLYHVQVGGVPDVSANHSDLLPVVDGVCQVRDEAGVAAPVREVAIHWCDAITTGAGVKGIPCHTYISYIEIDIRT